MIDLSKLEALLIENSIGLDEEFRRLFHGRGGLWEELKWLSIDSIDTILFVQLYYDCDKATLQELIELLRAYMQRSRHTRLILKHRYLRPIYTEVLQGEIKAEEVAIERGMRFCINLLHNQNIGYFGDMKNGRSYIEQIADSKRVLNLFSYTCGFSLFARRGGASKIVNVDMSKSALATGMRNHACNKLQSKGISYLPYNILKSLPKLKKRAPFDIIIIDPPTFQKRSFDAANDYIKTLQALDSLASEDATILACLNAPKLHSDFLVDSMQKAAPRFSYSHRIENPSQYQSLNESRSLKSLVFRASR